MPEGPEVHVMSSQVASLLGSGFSSDCLTTYTFHSSVRWTESLLQSVTPVGNHHICDFPCPIIYPGPVSVVYHKGKTTCLTVGGGVRILVAYGMTGSWSLQEGPYSRVRFTFDEGRQLFFNDVRKFGRVTVKDCDSRLDVIGPSMFHSNYPLHLDYYHKRYGRRGIRWFLLDPYIAPGVGNYIVNEALWLAKTHPSTLVSTLSFCDLQAITDACKKIYLNSLQWGGMTSSDYRHLDGTTGNYQSQLQCYRRKICSRCQTSIQRMADGDSGHYFCPTCQPAPRA